MASAKQGHFQRWQPGYGDAVRKFIISENFQGAVQLAVGILFVSLFVFVRPLRFPGSCVAVLLYIVVAVTAAPDNHVGTRIFLSGFMIGPMWLALGVGGVVGTIAKLTDNPMSHMVLLCVLGPLALIPFAIVRVGTSHLYLWAMGMVSALYVGMPIIAGFPLQDLREFWMRSVLFIIVAALVAMFAGSVLSMLVLPSLASHALEDDVSAALRQLGHHLSSTASHLFRPHSNLDLLPGHMHGMHPLLLQHMQHDADADQATAKPLLPGIFDKELFHNVTAQDVYVAVMDWFEHMSRPPAQQQKSSGSFIRCTQASRTSSASSTAAKSTFYGTDAAGLAAAVAAAVADSGCTDTDLALDSGETLEGDASDLGPFSAQAAANLPCLVKPQSTDVPLGNNLRQTSILEDNAGTCNIQNVAFPRLRDASSWTRTPHLRSLRLGSGSAAASFVAIQAKAAALAGAAGDTAAFEHPKTADKDQQADRARSNQGETGVDCANKAPHQYAPSPSIADVRQTLAHANQLLDAAAAEPQWLRGAARRFERAAWAEVIAKSQLLAMRLSALDLVKHEHMTLMDASHSFPISQEMEQLFKSVHGSAAAVLVLLADQMADRSGKRQGSTPAAAILQSDDWQHACKQLLHLVEETLMRYWHAVHGASPGAPVILPRAQWVRQYMFVSLATIGVLEAVDLLAKATAAALAAPVRGGCFSGTSGKQNQQRPTPDVVQTLKDLSNTATADEQETSDLEAGRAVAASTGSKLGIPTQQQQQQQQQQAKDTDQPYPAAPGAAAAAAGQGPTTGMLMQRLHASLTKHTAWIQPWLPLALNEIQFKHLHTVVTKGLPAMFSSKEAFRRQLKGRRFRAGLKYWLVLSVVMVAVLVLLYCIPGTYRYAPNFGYSAAAVGMSDRVESTMHKVAIWVSSSVVGAAIGWALMAHPLMANNPYALGAVMCTICLLVGSLGRSKNMLVTLYTLMTVASIVLCQYTPACCTDTGSTMMAVVRGASVAAAALFAVAVQNLVWPWFTSTWALEQLGLAYQEAADMLADLACEVYAATDALLQQHNSSTTMDRLAMLDAAVTRVQQQLRDQPANDTSRSALKGLSSRQASQETELAPVAEMVLKTLETAAAAGPRKLDVRTLRFSPSVSGSDVSAVLNQTAARSAPSHVDSSRVGMVSSAAEFNTAKAAGLVLGDSSQAFELLRNMMQLLQERRRLRHSKIGEPSNAAGDAAAVTLPSSPQQLQARLLKPLVQVKISLLLDTTAWSSGLYATPPVVLRLLRCMFDVADALGALQQANSVKVDALSGTWDWTQVHMAQAYGQLLLEVIAMADATLVHVMEPTQASAADLLRKIQDVQHQRYEYFARARDLRRLLHMALASDDQVYERHLADMQHWQLPGHMRYSTAVYATSKVLDRMTAVARCALETGGKR